MTTLQAGSLQNRIVTVKEAGNILSCLLNLHSYQQNLDRAAFVPFNQAQPHSGTAMSKHRCICYQSVDMMWYSVTVSVKMWKRIPAAAVGLSQYGIDGT